MDALLLLAKLEYAMGDYEGALNRLTAAGLDQLTEKALPTRSLRIVAESYAIKGGILYYCSGSGKTYYCHAGFSFFSPSICIYIYCH